VNLFLKGGTRPLQSWKIKNLRFWVFTAKTYPSMSFGYFWTYFT